MSARSNLDSDTVPYLFFLFIGLIGVVGSYAYWDQVGSHMLKTADWQRVPCTIIRSEIGSSPLSYQPYAFDVRYRFTYDGAEYTGSRLRLTGRTIGPAFEDRSEVAALVRQYRKGKQAVCYVNPENPAESVLQRRSILQAFTIVIPGAILAFSAIGLILTARWLPDPVRRKRLPKIILGTFAGLTLVVGMAMGAILAVQPAVAWLDARNWTQVTAVIEHSEVDLGSGPSGGSPYWDLRYRYEVDGEVYYGDDYSPLARGTYVGLESLAAQYPAETETTAWVDPANPDRAVLTRNVSLKRMLPAVAYLLFAVLIGVAFIYAALRRMRLGRNS